MTDTGSRAPDAAQRVKGAPGRDVVRGGPTSRPGGTFINGAKIKPAPGAPSQRAPLPQCAGALGKRCPIRYMLARGERNANRVTGDRSGTRMACPSCGAKFVTNRDGDWLRCG